MLFNASSIGLTFSFTAIVDVSTKLLAVTLPATPTPPLTTNEPVVVEVLATAFVILTCPLNVAVPSTDSSLLAGNPPGVTPS